jgi:hypothetical protein
MNIVGPALDRPQECEAVLRTLPLWFGIERATLMYVQDATKMPTFAIEEEQRIIAFLTLREHFPRAWGTGLLSLIVCNRVAHHHDVFDAPQRVGHASGHRGAALH